MKLLVTGGAGYIGSVMVRQLIETGYEVIVVDDLSYGHKDSVDKRAELIIGSIGETRLIDTLLSKNKINGVLHFAGAISVAESIKYPDKYFTNNTVYTLDLLKALVKHDVRFFIFSSTAGIYGNPKIIPIPENHQKTPESPYGESKLMIEQMLSWFEKAYGMQYCSLRYFNAAGATSDSLLGERHKVETHIIPNAFKAAVYALPFKLYGNDYATEDGTCIRDYIHVEDLCSAHIQALTYLFKEGKSDVFNIGTGQGYSNKQIIKEVEHVTGKKINLQNVSRRAGDADVLIADPSKIMKVVGWKPRFSEVQEIIKSAWQYYQKYPKVLECYL